MSIGTPCPPNVPGWFGWTVVDEEGMGADGKVQLDHSLPLNIFGLITIVWFRFGDNRFANLDVRPN